MMSKCFYIHSSISWPWTSLWNSKQRPRKNWKGTKSRRTISTISSFRISTSCYGLVLVTPALKLVSLVDRVGGATLKGRHISCPTHRQYRAPRQQICPSPPPVHSDVSVTALTSPVPLTPGHQSMSWLLKVALSSSPLWDSSTQWEGSLRH